MFIQSKYTNWYWNIINKSKTRGLNKKKVPFYTEKHHIEPKSCGGSNEKDNLVLLSAKEHFVCHHLLTKMMISKDHTIRMKHAFWRMITTQSKQFVSVRLYVYFKEKYASIMKMDSFKEKLSKCMKEYYKKYPISENSKEKHRKNIGQKSSRKLPFLIKKDGNEYKIDCLKEFCRQNKVSYPKLHQSAKFGYTTRDGWKVEYVN